jgi:subtilase family serine protease
VKGSFNAQNIGDKDASTTAYVSFYLSSDNTYSGDDTFLKQVSAGKLKKGASKRVSLSVTLPVGATASGKYVIAVIDPQNANPESNENNNQIVYGPIS